MKPTYILVFIYYLSVTHIDVCLIINSLKKLSTKESPDFVS